MAVTATGTDPDLASSAAPAAQAAADVGTADTATKAGHLLAAEDAEAFRARWTDVQHGFVDAPRQAVAQADGLVAELMQHLAKTFADERGRLEASGTRETTSPPRTCAPPSSATVCSSSDSSPPDPLTDRPHRRPRRLRWPAG